MAKPKTAKRKIKYLPKNIQVIETFPNITSAWALDWSHITAIHKRPKRRPKA